MSDRGMTSASDDAIRDYATRVGAVIVTKDEDFAVRPRRDRLTRVEVETHFRPGRDGRSPS